MIEPPDSAGSCAAMQLKVQSELQWSNERHVGILPLPESRGIQ
jgi:hypothetical protein